MAGIVIKTIYRFIINYQSTEDVVGESLVTT